MSNDVLITPASRKIEFKDSSANVDAKIETDASGNLVITNAGGDISIGDTTSDIFVGDGTNNIDIVFEQDGEIRGTSGVTVTLGQSDSNIRMATDLNLNNNDITNVGDLTVTGNLTITGDINSYNVTDLDVTDKTITLGVGQTEANSGSSGIIIDGSAASMLWDEGDNRFEFNKNIYAPVIYGSGAGITSLNASNISSGTLASARLPDLAVSDFAGSAIQTGSESFSDSDTILMTAAAVQDKILSYSYSTTDTTYTAGTGLTLSGTQFNVGGLTLSELASGSYQDSSSLASNGFYNTDVKILTSAAVDDLILSKGYTTNVGDVTSVSASSPLSVGGGAGPTPNISFVSAAITTSTSDADGDFFLVHSGTTSSGGLFKLTKANINLSGFNNDSGFLTGNQTITLSGDVSGSGTTSISVTVADDSHNHVISNVDGLQTALDGKLSTTGTAANSQLLDSLDSSAFLRSNASDTYSGGTLTFQAPTDGTAVFMTKATDSPDEPAILVLAGDADSEDDLAFEIRGNTTGSSVDLSTTMSSADTKFAIFQSGHTTIGYNSLGTGYTPVNAYGLNVNGTISAVNGYYAGSTQVINSSGNWVGGGNISEFTNNSGYITSSALSGYATESYVGTQISNLVDSAPSTLDTLNELAAALGDDANFSTTVTNSIATKLPLAGGTLTGTLNVSATTNARDIKISAGYHLQRSDHHSGHLEGSYNNVGVNSSKSNPIYTIGSSYNPTDAALSNMYGIGYTSSSASFASPAGTTNWGMYVAADGDARVWLDGSNGTIWSTGEHYSNNNRVFHDGYHPNADAWTTARTITLGGDLTGNVSIDGSANVTLTAAVVDDSHNHVISNVDGLQTALDGKLSTTGTAANSQLLDSLDSSQFLRSDTSDTLTSGTLTITGSTSAENAFRTTNGRIQLGHHSNGSGIWFDEANTAQYWFAGLTGQSFRLYRNANQLTLTNVGSLSTGAQGTVWGASNDGSGSGLDADTVDGIQSSRIVYGDNGTGTNSISGSALNPSGHLKSGFYKVTSASSTIPNATSVNFVMHTSYDTEGNTAGFDLAANDSTTSKFYLRPATGGGRGAWQTIWTSSSDGSGSGLDADLLDGQHGSHYLNYNNFTNTPTIPTNNNQLTNGAGYLTQSSAFNNQGQSHSTRTSFATGTPSFPFGFNFVQGSGNSPGVNSATQYYSLYTGLGSQYPATGSGSYGMEVAFPRNVSSPYIAIRYNENNSLGSWQKISAGYADSAGSVAWANVTGAPTIPTNNNQLTNGAGYITGVTDVAGWAGQLLREDNRIIAPNELTAGRLKFGFTSWANNNSSPYADFLHLRSYTDASGGADNLVMFKKSGIGMRIWQQTYGSTTAYSSYADVWHTSNDGSGSGLDADTVDGIQGGSLLRSDANDSWSGLLTSTISAGSTALDLSTNDGYANMRVIRNNGSSNTDGMFIGYGNANSGITRIFGGGVTSGGIVVSGSGANDIKYSGSSVLWHAGNDGSGSGLDADNLDGYAWTSQNKAVAARNLTIEAGDGQGLSFWGGTATPAGSNSYAIFMGTSGTYGRVDGETTSDYNMYFKMTAGTNRGFVFRNNTNNVVGIDSTGNLRAEADIVAYSGSDIRLKDNLTVISNPLEKLSKLSGYSFEWNSKQSAYAEGKKDIGLVAQEVEEVLPEIVKTRQDGFKGLQYEKLIPLLVEGMKEQQQQIEELKQQVKDLQGQK